MKTSVINKFLAFSSDVSGVLHIIIMASLCDFLNGKKILKERLNTGIREDVDYLSEQYDEFAKVKSFDEKLNLFSSSSFENLYQKMKEESFIRRDSDEPDMDIVELINTKFSNRYRIIEFMTKKNFSSVIVKWLKTDQHAKIAFCPFNNLVDVESGLSDVFKLYQSEVYALKLMAKQIILICNGKKFEYLSWTGPRAPSRASAITRARRPTARPSTRHPAGRRAPPCKSTLARCMKWPLSS